MIKLVVTYSRGKPFERENVTKVEYIDKEGAEATVEGDELLMHQFPVTQELRVYAAGGLSTVTCQGLRSINTFSVSDQEQ